MATILQKIVEAVIEDPVVNILAEPIHEGNTVAGLVPTLDSGPVIGRGRFQQTGLTQLPGERSSGASDKSKSATPESDNFSYPPKPGTGGEASSNPEPSEYTSSRSSTPYDGGKSNSNGSTEIDDSGAQEPPPDSDDDASPDEVSEESGGGEASSETRGDQSDPNEAPQPGATLGAIVTGTEGDDIIEVQFVFPAVIQTGPGTISGTTHAADVVTGNGGDDAISGGGGADVIDGGSGDDVLTGDGDDDILVGGAGNDILAGGGGTDQLIGGSGADRFVFDDVTASPPQAPDLVFDFNAAQGDQIDLSGIDAISGTTENDEFIFIGDDAFSGSGGELHLTQNISGGLLEGDVNGDATADFTINLLGVTSLTGDDITGLV